jgi:DNA polymerase
MILTIDFESYYSKSFSLSKMTTEEYIRAKRFEVIGVAVQSDDSDPAWYSGTKANVKKFLDQFDWANATAVAHNAAFDMAILNWHFDIRPKRIVDTLSMARAVHGTNVGGSLAALTQHYNLGAKGTEVNDALGKRRLDFNVDELARYGMYCKNDVVLTYKLLNKLMVDFPAVELGLIDLTVRMFTEPKLELDVEVLTSHLHEVTQAKEQLLAKITDSKEDIMSNPKLAVVLERLGVVPPMKTSLRTGKQAYAFAKSDQEFKALLEHENPTVQAVVAARLGVKSTLEESRTQRFIDIAGRGTLPIPLKYYAAHTGRWGGCIVADSLITVYNSQNGVEVKKIVDVLLDDLVWDGEEFVKHEGVVFSGFSEVIKWDGVEGTEDHVVYTDTGEISLREAMQGSHRLTATRSPTQDDVDAARKFARNDEAENSL